MTWTISAMGMPGPVRASLASQFASAKHNAEELPAERVTIEAIEKAVNSELDLLIGQLDRKTAVRVVSAGSVDAGSAPGIGGGTRLSLNIECLPEFLNHGRAEESDES
jgi:hypothetical protein